MPDRFRLPEFLAGYRTVIVFGLYVYGVRDDGLHLIAGPGCTPGAPIEDFVRTLESANALVKVGAENPAISKDVFALAEKIVAKALEAVPESLAVAA